MESTQPGTGSVCNSSNFKFFIETKLYYQPFWTCSLCAVLASVIQAVIAAQQGYSVWDIGAQNLQARVPFTVSLSFFFFFFKENISDGFCPAFAVNAGHQGNGSVSSGPRMLVGKLQTLVALS